MIMIGIVVALGGITFIVVSSEYLWRKHIIKGEYARKYVHILAGSYIAFWPFIISMQAVAILSALFFIAVGLSKQFKFFHAVHDVPRQTVGELLYPLGIFFSAILASADWIFTIAVLCLALADGFAAVVGKKYGKKPYIYKVAGSKKSIIGSMTYVMFAYVALLLGWISGGGSTLSASWFVAFVWLPLITVFLEAVSPFGLDNIAVPVFVTFVLNSILY